MCINPNILVPNGFYPSGKQKYDFFASARSHLKGSIRPSTLFSERNNWFVTDSILSQRPDAILAPCCQCIECRLKNANMKAIQVMHETQSYTHNSFVTLTYNDEHLPFNSGAIRPTLNSKHLTDFFKRFRRYLDYHGYSSIRYLAAGEYGDHSFRPHYHLIIFNWFPDDARYLPQCSSETIKCFTSPTIERLWPYGFNCIGSVNFNSARYVAQYSLKKQTGVNADYYSVNKIFPEFVHSSSNPGIGHDFFVRHHESIAANGYICLEGIKYSVPRYYIKLLERLNPALYDYFCKRRIANASGILHDFERDFAREEILLHKQERFRKSYEETLTALESYKKV